jgi:hypothetical protein
MDEIALATKLPALNDEFSAVPLPTVVLSVNGTEISEPSTHAYPVFGIALATQTVGTLMTSKVCDSNLVVNPSGDVTITANRTLVDAGAIVPSVNVSMDTECPDASYVYVPIVPYVRWGEVASTHDMAAVGCTSFAFVVVGSRPLSVSTIFATFPTPHTVLLTAVTP